MRIVFINHGDFGNNSHNHIRALASGLIARGHRVFVLASGDVQAADLPGGVAVDIGRLCSSHELQSALTAHDTVLHAWTPRERVRRLAQRLGAGRLRYVVHLEDNEEIVTATHCNTSWPELASLPDAALDGRIPAHLSYPGRYVNFLRGASCVTLITKSLRDICPWNVDTHVLEPGVDLAEFPRHDRRAEAARIASEFGFNPRAVLLMHPGSIHPANQEDIAALFAAVRILRAGGHEVVLLRPGNPSTFNGRSLALEDGTAVITPGFLPREELARWIGAAEIFVQPGGVTPFNVYRFPSKLPEFLASGRPTVTTAANLGLRLRHRRDAMLLRRGDAGELAAAISDVISSPSLAARLSRNGRRFARRHLRWADRIDGLERLYSQLPARA